MGCGKIDLWRWGVKQRDDNTCQICGETNSSLLVAHHKKSTRDYPELGFEIKNGMTLCRVCHFIVHERISPSVLHLPRIVTRVGNRYTWCAGKITVNPLEKR